MKARCNHFVQWEDTFGDYQYTPCTHKPKYQVSYLDVRGKMKTEKVCGIHFNSLQKSAARVLKNLKYDSKFTFKELN